MMLSYKIRILDYDKFTICDENIFSGMAYKGKFLDFRTLPLKTLIGNRPSSKVSFTI